MGITKEQAENFVHFGEDHYSNFKTLKDMIYVYLGAAWFLWIPFVVDGRGFVFNIILTALAFIYIIAIYFLKSNFVKKTYRLRFLTNSLSYLFMYLLFYLFPLFFINVSDVGSTLWQNIELTICFIVFPLTSLFVTLIAIKKNAYDRDTPKRNIVKISIFPGVLGILIGRILEPMITQSQAISILVIITEVLLLLISFASPSILRLYFAYKYKIVAGIDGEESSPDLIYDMPKKKIGIRMMKLIFKIMIVGFAIAMLYGMHQVSNQALI